VPKWTLLFLLALIPLPAHAQAARAEYVGGTNAQLDTGGSGAIDMSDDHYFVFYGRKASVRVAYDRINLVEYGQQVSRRIAMAAIVSPLLLLAKSRKHFLTVGYTDDAGKQEALVFRVDKNSIRTTLVSLEARTGRKIEFQDEEARKAGKG